MTGNTVPKLRWNAKNLTGQYFGRLLVIEPTEKRKWDHVAWKCLCSCGAICYVTSGNLLSGHTKSCGCLQKERIIEANTKHGYCTHLLYPVWWGIIARCENSKNLAYKNYGGRGIRVCAEWHDSQKFIEWGLANGWKKGLLIDRRNNNGNYEPSNCHFVTYLKQANNTRKLKLFIAYGPCGQIEMAKNQSSFARKWDLCQAAISACLLGKRKIHKGWKFELQKLKIQ